MRSERRSGRLLIGLAVASAGTLAGGCSDKRGAAEDAAVGRDAGEDAAGSTCGDDVSVNDLALEVVASGLEEPVWTGSPPGDERLFVLERPGRVRVVVDGALLEEPVLSIPVELAQAEQGLLGLAFHPEWPARPSFFVHYSELGTGHTVIAEYQVSAEAPNGPAGEERRVLLIEQVHDYHNGGGLAFGPDGYLYIAVGDDGFSELAQDPASLLGKLLRIDIDRRDGNRPVDSDGDQIADYAIPVDNPFAGGQGAAREEVWAVGLRNPWRFSFDRATGALYVGDVGQKLREEIDVVERADGNGANFGWRIREGTLCFNPDDFFDENFGPCENLEHEIAPAIEYPRGNSAAVVGGHVYRGSCMPDLAGVYFYGDNARNFIRTFRWSAGAVTEEVDITASLVDGPVPGFVTSFGEDAAGEVYVVTYNASGAPGGVVARIVPRP